MFSNAYEIASNFTRPVILSMRQIDGTVECALGSFTILNPEGWIVTAAHIVSINQTYKQHKKEIDEYNNRVAEINNENKFNAKQKKKKISKLARNKQWLTNISFWWGEDGAKVDNFKVLPLADIAVGKLSNFDLSKVNIYPTIISPDRMRPGTSLCKLGFPFHKIEATFDETSSSFSLQPGSIPVPMFPIEGIFTRHIIAGSTPDGKYQIKFIETSSPGLKGQSGGPIFDVDGNIWGIQSRTQHLPLGFSPKVKKDGKEIEEHQFINVGWGVHPEVLIIFLKDNKVPFSIQAD